MAGNPLNGDCDLSWVWACSFIITNNCNCTCHPCGKYMQIDFHGNKMLDLSMPNPFYSQISREWHYFKLRNGPLISVSVGLKGSDLKVSFRLTGMMIWQTADESGQLGLLFTDTPCKTKSLCITHTHPLPSKYTQTQTQYFLYISCLLLSFIVSHTYWSRNHDACNMSDYDTKPEMRGTRAYVCVCLCARACIPTSAVLHQIQVI